MCEKCERIYLLAHPDSAKRIQFTPGSDRRFPYRLTCMCKTERYFDKGQTLPYRVSEYICIRGMRIATSTTPYQSEDLSDETRQVSMREIAWLLQMRVSLPVATDKGIDHSVPTETPNLLVI